MMHDSDTDHDTDTVWKQHKKVSTGNVMILRITITQPDDSESRLVQTTCGK